MVPIASTIRRLDWQQAFRRPQGPVAAGLHRLQRMAGVQPHDHEFVEIATVVSGEGTHFTTQGARRIRPGDVLIVAPGQWHDFLADPRLDVFNCCFDADLIDRELGELSTDPALAGLLPAGGRRPETKPTDLWLPPKALRSCRAILDGLEGATAPGRGSRLDAVGYLMLFLGRLSRTAVSPTPTTRPAPALDVVAEAVRLLEEDPRHDWSLGELAERLAVDRHHLCRCFKAQMGLPPMAYLADHRAHLAATLLRETCRPIAQVGAEVGWADPNYFARRFRDHFGQSPSSYRQDPAIPLSQTRVEPTA